VTRAQLRPDRPTGGEDWILADLRESLLLPAGINLQSLLALEGHHQNPQGRILDVRDCKPRRQTCTGFGAEFVQSILNRLLADDFRAKDHPPSALNQYNSSADCDEEKNKNECGRP